MTTPKKQSLSKFSKSIKKTCLFDAIKARAEAKNKFLIDKLRRVPVHRAQKPVRKPINFLIWPEGKSMKGVKNGDASLKFDDFASLCNSQHAGRIASFGTEKFNHVLHQTSGLNGSTEAQSTVNGLTA